MAHSACGFQTFDHTADIGIRAWGRELTEVFVEAARGLFSVMADISNVTPKQKIQLNLSAESNEELLLVWLKELLFIFDTQHLLLAEFKIRKLDSHSLVAEVSGELLDEKKHILGREVKAITRHQFKLQKERSRYLCEIILDI